MSDDEKPVGDAYFLEVVERCRPLGYGRMMHLIAERWRQVDPVAALTVGDACAVRDRKRARCAREGHDPSHGNSYDWCDRCGVRLDPDTGKEIGW